MHQTVAKIHFGMFFCLLLEGSQRVMIPMLGDFNVAPDTKLDHSARSNTPSSSNFNTYIQQ